MPPFDDWEGTDFVTWLRQTAGEPGDTSAHGSVIGLLTSMSTHLNAIAAPGVQPVATEAGEVAAAGVWAQLPTVPDVVEAVLFAAAGVLGEVRYRIGPAGNGVAIPAGQAVRLPVSDLSAVWVLGPAVTGAVAYVALGAP